MCTNFVIKVKNPNNKTTKNVVARTMEFAIDMKSELFFRDGNNKPFNQCLMGGE